MSNDSVINVTSKQWWVLIFGKFRKSYELLSDAEDEGKRLDEYGKGFTIDRVIETRTYLPDSMAQKASETFILPIRE